MKQVTQKNAGLSFGGSFDGIEGAREEISKPLKKYVGKAAAAGKWAESVADGDAIELMLKIGELATKKAQLGGVDKMSEFYVEGHKAALSMIDNLKFNDGVLARIDAITDWCSTKETQGMDGGEALLRTVTGIFHALD